MNGGTISSGCSCTWAVVGAYWMSCAIGVLVNHRTRRHGDIAADFERRFVRHLDAAALQVCAQVLQPSRQALSLRARG